MKKLLLIIALVPMFIVAMSQDNSSYYDKYINAKTNYGIYTGKATDTINGVATTDAIFFVETARYSRYTLSYYVSGDTLTGCNGNVTIQPYGSYDGVTYTSLGSSVTWTTTADYDANTQQNTYSVAVAGTETNAQHTETTAAFNIWTVDSLLYDDTLHVPAQTNTVAAQTVTVAVTNTVTLPGTDYFYIKILLTGASSARVELQAVAIKVTPVTIPF